MRHRARAVEAARRPCETRAGCDFGIVLLGVILACLKFFNAHTSDGLAAFMYYVAIPALLFKRLATTPLPAHPPWAYFLAFYGPTIGAAFIMHQLR